MTNIEELEGIGPAFAAKLQEAGIRTVEGLLAAGGARAGRESIAVNIGVEPGRVLEWVNRADLMRINGVGSEYADLLEAAGVDTVKELATRNPANLHAKVVETNDAKKLVRRTPTEADVTKWVTEAKSLPAAVTH
jgi:predicted flap endonuclease-1-like 5' DNA nuclease